MNIHIKDIAELIGGEIIGNDDLTISGLSKIEEAKAGELTFLYSSNYIKYLPETQATVVIIKPEFQRTNPKVTYILNDSPNHAIQKIILNFFNPEFNLTGKDDTAFVDPTVKNGINLAVGKNVVIENNCVIGNDVKIFHNCVIHPNVTIGNNCLIFANVTIRENCRIGDNVIIHSGTVIGADGFGYLPDKVGNYTKVPQIGNVIIEDDVELGANVTIDRAALGSTIISKGSKIDNLVQIGHNVFVGQHTVISAQSGIAGSTKVGNYCMLGGQAGLTGHIEITDKVLIGAQSGVSKNIVKPGTYFGSPADEIGGVLKIQAHLRNLPDYVKKIKELEKEIQYIKDKIKDSE